MIGVINLDKPVGPTSHDMVGLVRRLSGLRRIGHAGTLDPLASGVLPILVGPATRLSQELTGGRKRYDAIVRLGFRSQTDDAEGPIEAGEPPPDEDAVRAALPEFVGTFEQRPPAFSARKAGGVVAYQAARQGEALELTPREVTIHAVRLLDVSQGEGYLDVHLDLETGSGTYIRSVARDLGERLGSGGYLHALRRTEAAGLSASEGHTPEALEALAAAGTLDEALIPVEQLLDLHAVTLDADQAGRFTHGGEVAWSGDGRVQVHGPAGLLGIGELGDGRLRPRTVLAEGG
ncbi:MAG TPA: tRNA pseudouridine(55) synthase TruB [Candidatus Limnocylindria bacterium]|jgi:tRNA pseudouridine55 synthase